MSLLIEGGLITLKKINIQGSADSARPTEDVPSGYDGLDHPDGIYGGETDDTESCLLYTSPSPRDS